MFARLSLLVLLLSALAVGCATPAQHRGYKRYVGAATVATTGALVAGLYIADDINPDGGEALLALGAVGYVAAVPAIHALEGNRREALHSALRRVVLPVVLGGGAALVARAAEGDDCYDTCGLGPALLGTLGVAIGVTTATIWDVKTAHVPVVTTDGDRTMIGLGGRF